MNELATNEISFEDALQKLEMLVRELESGRIKLDDAVAAYEQATVLKKFCEEKLKAAQLKIEKLEVSPEGELKTVPLDPKEE